MDNPVKEMKYGNDLYRDTPVRYLGYSNEVGEAFRGIISTTAVRASYGVAIAYVLADTYDKSKKKYHSTNQLTPTLTAAADTLLWQMLASVIVPGFTINRLCAGSHYVLKQTRLPTTSRKWIVTAIGLCSIPFIIHPIDEIIDYTMDKTFRRVFK